MTTPTTTAQATVLTEEQLDNAFALLWNLSEPSANSTIAEIVSHIDALTEQVRVLEDQLTDCQVERDDHFVELDRARRALAALEGSGESE